MIAANESQARNIQKLILAAILVIYMVVAFLYARSVPKWNAPDEPSHFNYVKTITQTWTFPILKQGDYDFAYLEKAKAAKFPDSMPIDSIRYEFHHPPLYYMLASPFLLLSSGLPIDTQVLILRLLSALFGALTIVVTFLIAQHLFPEDKILPLAASAFVAFVPMHIFMNASINNDSLANFLLSALLLALITSQSRRIKEAPTTKFMDRDSLLLGVILGLCLLAKVTAYIGVVLVALVIVWQEILQNNWNLQSFRRLSIFRNAAWRLAKIYVIALVLGGWWFVRNAIVYGNLDIFGLKRHDLVVVGQPLTGKFGLAAARNFFFLSFKSFWGVFGWMGIFMDERIYVILGLISAVATLGFLLYIVRAWLRPSELSTHQKFSLFLLFAALALIFAGWFQYNLTYIQAQGRYLFPTISAIAIFFSLGLREIISKRHAATVFSLLVLGLLALDILSLYRFIIPQLR